MTERRGKRTLSTLLISGLCLGLGGYFAYAAVQGEYGLFRRIQIESHEATLTLQLAALEAEVAAMKNKTRRMSDGYLDLDLLDEQARKVLGYAQPGEVIIR